MEVIKIYHNGEYQGYFTDEQTAHDWLIANPGYEAEPGEVDYSESDLCCFKNKPINEQTEIIRNATIADALFICKHENAYITDGKVNHMATKYIELADRCPECLMFCELPE